MAPNNFYSFMLDFKKQNKIQSHNEAMEKADAIWRNMTAEEKKMYGGKKKNNKTKAAPVSTLESQQNARIKFEQEMKDNISTEITLAMKYNNLTNCQFYVININSFCLESDNKRYYPCEIGISGFSMLHGVSEGDIFEELIYPGPLPYGYSGEAKQTSNETHQIPWDYGSTDNQKEVFHGVLKFLMSRSKITQKLPFLYARPTNMEMVQSVLDTWCEEYDSNSSFKVYNVTTLFNLLHENIIKNTGEHPSVISYREFDRDVHQYDLNIACEYHRSIDMSVYCSKSTAIRSCYLICQNICPGLNIDLVPGQHIPHTFIKHSEVKKTTRKLNYDSSSTVREDSSDAETIMSLGKTSTCMEDSSSSIILPEYDERVSSRRKFDNNYMSGSSNSINDLTSRTGSSGFSRRPAVLPSSVNEAFSKLTTDKGSTHTKREAFPSSRGRGGTPVKGKGRGHPFRK